MFALIGLNHLVNLGIGLTTRPVEVARRPSPGVSPSGVCALVPNRVAAV